MWARNYGPLELLRAQAITTTTASPGYVDLQPYASLAKREVKAVVLVGAMTTTTTVTVAVKECDTTNGSYTAPAYGTTSQAATTTAGQQLEFNFRADKRYVQLSITVDATGSVPMAATLVALKKEA